MKNFISLFSLFLFLSCATIMPQQQQYRSHTVAQGETVYSIAQKYGVTEAAIVILNPETENGIYPNTVLKIPREASIFDNADIYFKEHKVEKGETLYRIAKDNGVSEEVIKKFNEHLYTEHIRTGEIIRIPIKKRNGVNLEDSKEPIKEVSTHTVKSKETLSSISRDYGVSVSDIRALNPNLGNVLSEGTILLIPMDVGADLEEEGFVYYEVQEAEGYFRIQQRFNITKEEIIKHNPLAGDGLRKGMILKIPVDTLEEGDEELVFTHTVVDLKEHIKNRSAKNIALMLPLRLSRVQAEDSIKANTKLLQNDATLRIALDFYRGAIMASEDATKLGLPVNLRVFDTEGSANKVSQIISNNNFKDFDAVIGPVLASEVERAARDLQRDKVAVFAPLTNRVSGNYNNLFQTLPTNTELENLMFDHIERQSQGKKVIFITDLNAGNAKYTKMRNLVPGITTITPTEKGFLYINEIQPFLSKEQTNWIILESKDPLLVSNVVGMLNGIARDYDMQLMTTDKNNAYDYHDVSNRHLARLKFTFPSINKSSHLDESTEFMKEYKKRYHMEPNRYVVRGYDLTMDVLLRLASDKNIYKASDSAYLTEYIENKFQYLSKSRDSYKNKSGYIVQFTDDLNLVVIE